MRKLIYYFLQFFFTLLPITKNKIIFISYYGKQYGCSPKYLSEFIVKKHPNWKIVWAFTNPVKYSISGVKKVKYLSICYFYELCTSKVLVTNYRMTDIYNKRNGQYYIMTWHSSLRLKKIEGDVENYLPESYIRMAKLDSKKIDLLLSGCKFSDDIFRRAFWYNGTILPSGTPRCDIFYTNKKSYIVSIVKEKLGIAKDLNVLLYAPTFRKNNNLDCYNLDYKLLVEQLRKYNGHNWQVLVRLHPHLSSYSYQLLNNSGAIDVTEYDDIQELLLIADVLITDYSSLMFDYAETRKPCFIYAPDLEEYQKTERSLYFDIKCLPFLLSQNQSELFQQISIFNEDKYKIAVDSFMKSVGSYEDGKASERVTKYIEKWIK